MSDEPETGQGEPEQKREPWRKRHPRWAWTGAIAGTAVFIVLLIWGPWWIEGHHLRDNKGQLISSAGIIVTGFRTMLVAIAAGGFTAAGLYYTRQKHQLERDQFQHAQDQFTAGQEQFAATLRESQESQVTGRYVEAIKLLASERCHENLGGIYSLERILKDSDRDRATAVEVLAAYVRSRLDGNDKQLEQEYLEQGQPDANLRLAEDIRAALRVLGRNWEDGHPRADLRSINLEGWDATETMLRGAFMIKAQLPGANLLGAILEHAQLQQANLAGAILYNTAAYGATLTAAQLQAADLRYAWLTGANLRTAALQNAKLDYAHLIDTDLRGANLEGTELAGAELDGADLRKTEGLEVHQICQARIFNATILPASLEGSLLVIKRQEECEAARAKGTTPPAWGG
ncbi:pentapeptide repeat-containing protein [Streptomyces sp. cg28]|uniref:pentapeptide repeat-containing protein n=1 Tax=Streptomyces sp. cg28 TaxID=3403457 RepID=UPI003B20C4AF